MKNSSNKFRGKNNKQYQKYSDFGYYSKNTNRSEKNVRFLNNSAKNKNVENLKNGLPVVIDLTKIDFLDSSGLGALVQTSKECKKSKLGFSVVGNSRVAQTIKLVRLGDFLNLKSSLEDALNYLKN